MVVRVSGVLRRTVAGGNGPFDKDVIYTESQIGGGGGGGDNWHPRDPPSFATT